MLLHAMGTISQPILGFLSDRFGRKAVLLPSFITLGLLFLLLAVAAAGIQLGLVITVIGVFFYTLMNITNAAVMDVAGSKIQASSYGLTSLLTQPYSCINFADKVKKSPVFQHLRIATGSWLDFTSGEFQRQPQRADYVLQFRRQTVRRRDPVPQ